MQSLPDKVTVRKLVSSRYGGAGRPSSWDARREGVDEVELSDGRTVKLLSDGGQSAPAAGWVLMLLDGDGARGFRWTLYGMPQTRDSRKEAHSPHS